MFLFCSCSPHGWVSPFRRPFRRCREPDGAVDGVRNVLSDDVPPGSGYTSSSPFTMSALFGNAPTKRTGMFLTRGNKLATAAAEITRGGGELMDPTLQSWKVSLRQGTCQLVANWYRRQDWASHMVRNVASRLCAHGWVSPVFPAKGWVSSLLPPLLPASRKAGCPRIAPPYCRPPHCR